MRLGDWKLFEYFEDGSLELFHLDSDIGERHNLAEELPEKTAELYEVLTTWRKAIRVPVPTEKNADCDPAAEKNALKHLYSKN